VTPAIVVALAWKCIDAEGAVEVTRSQLRTFVDIIEASISLVAEFADTFLVIDQFVVDTVLFRIARFYLTRGPDLLEDVPVILLSKKRCVRQRAEKNEKDDLLDDSRHDIM
jgi:hypothetical protein